MFYKLIDLRNKHWRFEFVKEYENFNIFIGPGMGNGFLKLSFPPDSEYCITTVNLRKDVERGGSPLTYAQLLYNIGVVLEYLINEYDSLEEDIKKW